MNIKGQCHSLTFVQGFVQGHSYSTFSNFFSLETPRPIEAKFHMQPPWDRGMKVNAIGLCHITKVAAMSIYGKPLKIFFSETKRPMTLKLGMQHWLLRYYQMYSNDDPGLTLTYFTARSNFCMGKCLSCRFPRNY